METEVLDLSKVCNNCGESITMDGDGFFHPGTESELCEYNSFYNRMLATPIVAKKYTVLMNDGLPGMAVGPRRPVSSNQAASLREAKRLFRDWMERTGNDYLRADGWSQPQAEVILTERWDGFGYGDYPWTCLLVRGVKGGVLIESV